MHIPTNLACYTSKREVSPSVHETLKRKFRVSYENVSSLACESVLSGHNGCVNCLEWNASGDLLASGSDDRTLILWHPFAAKLISTLSTPHTQNIFSVKFLPGHGDNLLASGAGDGRVCLTDVSAGKLMKTVETQYGKVKKLATAQTLSSVFWSAAENGFIIQHDCRLDKTSVLVHPVSVLDRNKYSSTLEAKCLDINPANDNEVAIGFSDPFVRIYDRRMLKLLNPVDVRKTVASITPRVMGGTLENFCDANISRWESFIGGTGAGLCSKYLIPHHILKPAKPMPGKLFGISATHVSYNSNGTQLLANLNVEQVYLFDLTENSPRNSTRLIPSTEPLDPDMAHVCRRKPGIASRTKKEIQELLTFDPPPRPSEIWPELEHPKATRFEPSKQSGKTYSERTINEVVMETSAWCDQMRAAPADVQFGLLRKYGCSVLDGEVKACPCLDTSISRRVDVLKSAANHAFTVKDYTQSIRIYNVALTLSPQCAILYCNRAAAWLGRDWLGDQSAAARDCLTAISIDPTYFKAYVRLCQCLRLLNFTEDHDAVVAMTKDRFPAPAKRNASLLKRIHSTNNKGNDRKRRKNNTRTSKSSTNSTVPFPSYSDSSDDDMDGNADSVGSSSQKTRHRVLGEISSRLREALQKERAALADSIDFSKRFCGHLNSQTDIKEANFFGTNYVVAGSDDGRFYVWDMASTNLIRTMPADDSCVNIVNPHPDVCALATSGIDSTIKIWSPSGGSHAGSLHGLCSRRGFRRRNRRLVPFDDELADDDSEASDVPPVDIIPSSDTDSHDESVTHLRTRSSPAQSSYDIGEYGARSSLHGDTAECLPEGHVDWHNLDRQATANAQQMVTGGDPMDFLFRQLGFRPRLRTSSPGNEGDEVPASGDVDSQPCQQM